MGGGGRERGEVRGERCAAACTRDAGVTNTQEPYYRLPLSPPARIANGGPAMGRGTHRPSPAAHPQGGSTSDAGESASLAQFGPPLRRAKYLQGGLGVQNKQVKTSPVQQLHKRAVGLQKQRPAALRSGGSQTPPYRGLPRCHGVGPREARSRSSVTTTSESALALIRPGVAGVEDGPGKKRKCKSFFFFFIHDS